MRLIHHDITTDNNISKLINITKASFSTANHCMRMRPSLEYPNNSSSAEIGRSARIVNYLYNMLFTVTAVSSMLFIFEG